MEQNASETIDLRAVWSRLKSRKKLFLKVLGITFVLSCVYIIPVPRTYTSTVTLAPETSGTASGGSLASMASSFGFDIGSLQQDDAVYPLLYPDIVGSSEFLVSLFNIQVKTEDGEIATDYYTYLTKHHKKSPWSVPMIYVKKSIGKLIGTKRKAGRGTPGNPDPFMLSQDDYELVEGLRDAIVCDVDKKTDVISITVSDQDRVVCAAMADSVRLRLQERITAYRTQKARTDLNHYKEMAETAYKDYEKAAAAYADYADTHQNSVLASSNTKETALENAMQTAYTIYTQYKSQVQLFEGKVQERTPAFVVLDAATVPVKPAKPKRMIFVILMMMLSTVGCTAWVFKDAVSKELRQLK